jgi:hypothetical protein
MMYVEGCRRLSVHDGLSNITWFCVCKLGDSLAGMNVSWVVVGASASALGNRRVCVIRVTSMRDMNSMRMFEEDVTIPEDARVIQGGGSLGVWVGGVM